MNTQDHSFTYLFEDIEISDDRIHLVLTFAAGYLLRAYGPDRDFCTKIAQIYNRKGELHVDWVLPPSNLQKQAIASGWAFCGEIPEHVFHHVRHQSPPAPSFLEASS